MFGDGPGPDRPGEKEKCAAARSVVRKLVDWNCELIEKYSDENLGCERGLPVKSWFSGSVHPAGSSVGPASISSVGGR